MRKIILTHGKVALVDDADYDWLSQWNWYAHKIGLSLYAVRHSSRKNGKQYLISMAREILGLKYKDKRQADHINHSTLNNCRNNLRICTASQNQMNRKPVLNTTSRYKGVYRHTKNKRWVAQIKINGKMNYLACFNKEEDAALAYDKAAEEQFGKFAYLNFSASVT